MGITMSSSSLRRGVGETDETPIGEREAGTEQRERERERSLNSELKAPTVSNLHT